MKKMSRILVAVLCLMVLPLVMACGKAHTIYFDANGGTGSISAVSVNAGSSTTLNNGSTLTPPSNKEFAGWALVSGATEPEYDGAWRQPPFPLPCSIHKLYLTSVNTFNIAPLALCGRAGLVYYRR